MATSASCHDDDDAAAGVCRPRVRARLLLAGSSGAARDLAAGAAERLRTGLVECADVDAALEELGRARVSCVLLDADGAGTDAMSVLAKLSTAAEGTPVVVLGPDADSAVAIAAVQAGAQDYLVRGEVDPAALERSIRHAIDRKRNEAQLAQLALHDHLTGLANRSLFDERLRGALARPAGDGRRVAVLFVDIDDFKRINDGLGHNAGDRTLREAAARIRAAVRPGDVVARLGGDEFTVLCDGVPSRRAALAIGRRINDALRRPFTLDGGEIVLRASIGVALADDGTTAEELLQHSDEAMYRAKARGGGCPQVHAPGAGHARRGDLHVESALRRAIPDELVAHYQPVVALEDGGLVGVEALVRWQRPGSGLVPPGEFIPVAEHSGLVVPLGRWMIEEACRQAVRWGGVRVSVNVSGRQVAEGSLVTTVARALAETGVEPQLLQLELTETVLLDDVDGHAELLRRLSGLGVTLALDDFGKGYSSLSYLHRFPFQRVKIDRSFVAGLPDGRADRAIVAAVVSFAAALDMEVVAEGVETQAHVDVLRELGCPYGQGFFFERPVEPGRIAEMLAAAA